ncbi:HAMP domain-containing histidine kinase [Acidaminobacter sp. JC074]|uniref:HAMP domain-containing sensor histidine kinase n=1 Tax=Acidaminobacter sp. JC074 TaxID=2530199 RepID=UPI001F0FB92D|nr:HAMP domain-containing sensor histidine kinase [Acidaminobacter sp. JC074]MCH4886932.1 HAMP domain-containing histidine kinase [Acidaminobacter sp. JC074]
MLKKIQEMVHSKIANKIFVTSILLVSIILLIQAFLYLFVIDDAQIISSQVKLSTTFESFMKELKESNYDREYANILTEDFFIDSGHAIAIIDEDYTIYNEAYIKSTSHMLTLEKDNVVYDVAINNSQFDALQNDKVSLLATKVSENIYVTHMIGDDLKDVMDDDVLSYYDTPEGLILIDAEIRDITISQWDSNDSLYNLYTADDFIKKYDFNSQKNNQAFVYDHENLDANTFYIISHFKLEGKLYYVIGYKTIIGLRDQLDFITQFNVFVFVIGMIAAIIISRIFSKSLSKPMVELESIANQMADLDFTKKAIVESPDELGSLARSLNKMSSELDQNIKDLQENYELKAKEEQRAKDLILHLSHELNTPLGIVSGFTEILSDGINDKPPEYYYETMTYELERMKTLVSDMLELSVLESGSYEMKLEPARLSDLINKSIRDHAETFESKNIRITNHVSDDLVDANNSKIAQVIDNFVSNACKYTQENGHFRVSSIRQIDHIIYRFENSCDLEEDNLNLLWEKFYRTKKSNTRKEKGSGIGLSIAKEILELHGSPYDIKRTPDGIAFEFSLKTSS